MTDSKCSLWKVKGGHPCRYFTKSMLRLDLSNRMGATDGMKMTLIPTTLQFFFFEFYLCTGVSRMSFPSYLLPMLAFICSHHMHSLFDLLQTHS